MTPRLKTAHINGLRLLVHLASLGFLLWLLVAVPGGLLGGDPVQGLTHYLGKGALHLLLLTLLVSPLAKRWRQGQLIKLRRPLGLWCAAWAGLHFMVWLGLDLQFDWGLIGGELVKRSYIVVGMVALLLLLALGLWLLMRGQSYNEVLLAVVIHGLGAGLLVPNVMAPVMEALSARTRGRGLGGFTACLYFGQFVSPLVVAVLGAFAGDLRHAIEWLAFASLGAALLWGIAALSRHRSNPLAPSTHSSLK